MYVIELCFFFSVGSETHCLCWFKSVRLNKFLVWLNRSDFSRWFESNFRLFKSISLWLYLVLKRYNLLTPFRVWLSSDLQCIFPFTDSGDLDSLNQSSHEIHVLVILHFVSELESHFSSCQRFDFLLVKKWRKVWMLGPARLAWVTRTRSVSSVSRISNNIRPRCCKGCLNTSADQMLHHPEFGAQDCSPSLNTACFLVFKGGILTS